MATVVVIGLGDLGSRVLDILARSQRLERLVGSSRDAEHGEARAAQCRLVAALQGGPRQVEFVRNDVSDIAATAGLLRSLDPDVMVTAASRHTWWRRGVEGVPYGAWLPLQLTLVRDLVRARNDAGLGAPIVCLPFPDNVGPALAPLGLAPELGAGNVTETAAKLELLAGEGAEARLVLHHAAQRYAFPDFAALGGGETEEPRVGGGGARGRRAPGRTSACRELFHAPWPLPWGRDSHDLTAAATAQIVEALLSDEPVRTHAPAPDGRPGGYPLLVSRGRIELDLPAGLSEDEAVAINAGPPAGTASSASSRTGRWSSPAAVAEATERHLGVRVDRVAPATSTRSRTSSSAPAIRAARASSAPGLAGAARRRRRSGPPATRPRPPESWMPLPPSPARWWKPGSAAASPSTGAPSGASG